MPFYGLLFPSVQSCFAPITLTLDHPLPHHSDTAYMYVCYFYLHPLSFVLSLTLLTHPTHSYLLLPHLIFHNSESYSFYIYLLLWLLLEYVCAQDLP